jgi:hypothetical protein
LVFLHQDLIQFQKQSGNAVPDKMCAQEKQNNYGNPGSIPAKNRIGGKEERKHGCGIYIVCKYNGCSFLSNHAVHASDQTAYYKATFFTPCFRMTAVRVVVVPDHVFLPFCIRYLAAKPLVPLVQKAAGFPTCILKRR